MTLDLAFDLVVFLFLGSSVLSLVRVIMGPTSADRLIGLNIVAAQILAILVLVAVKEGLHVYLDVALVYDIFGFVGLLAITRFFGKKGDL
ncbi:MAG TPA: pH regulation protein F [bacterium]|nr:pH regulation protein F [bacterium]